MIAIIVVNHNTRTHLDNCLETILQDEAEEVIVVDNASTDGSAALVENRYPWVTLIKNDKNPGYGSAANQAIERSRSPYVLLLNSDTRLLPGAIQSLSAYLDRHPRAAVVGPRLLNPDGTLQPSCYADPTPLYIFLEESTLSRYVAAFPVLRDRYLRTWQHNHSRSVPWVLGAALAIRREAFASAGGFDPSYFMYAEEVDLCYRLREAGWEIHFTPDANIIHIGGASTSLRRAEMSVQYFESLVHFYHQHYSRLSLGQLQLVMKMIMLGRLARDSLLLHLASESQQQAKLSENLTAWRRILFHHGSPRLARSE